MPPKKKANRHATQRKGSGTSRSGKRTHQQSLADPVDPFDSSTGFQNQPPLEDYQASSELNLSPLEGDSGFGEFIDDEWRMDPVLRDDIIHARDSSARAQFRKDQGESPAGPAGVHPSTKPKKGRTVKRKRSK